MNEKEPEKIGNTLKNAIKVISSPCTTPAAMLAVSAIMFICPDAGAADLGVFTMLGRSAKTLIMGILMFVGLSFIVHGAMQKKRGEEGWINSIAAGCLLAAGPAIVVYFWSTAGEDTTVFSN